MVQIQRTCLLAWDIVVLGCPPCGTNMPSWCLFIHVVLPLTTHWQESLGDVRPWAILQAADPHVPDSSTVMLHCHSKCTKMYMYRVPHLESVTVHWSLARQSFPWQLEPKLAVDHKSGKHTPCYIRECIYIYIYIYTNINDLARKIKQTIVTVCINSRKMHLTL